MLNCSRPGLRRVPASRSRARLYLKSCWRWLQQLVQCQALRFQELLAHVSLRLEALFTLKLGLISTIKARNSRPLLDLVTQKSSRAARWAGSPLGRPTPTRGPDVFLPALQQHKTRQQGEQAARLPISFVSLQRCFFAKSRYLLPSSYKERIGD